MDIEQTPGVVARPALPLDPKACVLGRVCVCTCKILILGVTNVRAWLWMLQTHFCWTLLANCAATVLLAACSLRCYLQFSSQPKK